MNVIDSFVKNVKKMLGFKESLDTTLEIRSGHGHQTRALEHQVWYNGDVVSLLDFYSQTGGLGVDNSANSFWRASNGAPRIRKHHVDLAKMIPDKLAGIVSNDILEPSFNDDKEAEAKWQEITNVIDLKAKTHNATIPALVQGDGAFKVYWDITETDYPIVEFYDSLHTDFIYKYGILKEIIFKEEFVEGNKDYILMYHYGYGYIRYSLHKVTESKTYNQISMTETEYTKELEDIDLSGFGRGMENVMLAVPYIIKESTIYKGRGESIFHGKLDAFDSLDEVVSTWLDALRNGRVKRFYPESLIPRDSTGGSRIPPNPFNDYYAIGDQMKEGVQDTMQTVSEHLDYQGLLASYTSFLDMCLAGVISPSTLGIDVKKLDNAESQREKEKSTLYTRDTIVSVLEKVLPALIQRILYVYDILEGNTLDIVENDYEVTIGFGQYANPSFETLLATIGDAVSKGVMSIPKAIDELYGDSMTPEEKAEEVARLEAKVEKQKPETEEKVPPNEEDEDIESKGGSKE